MAGKRKKHAAGFKAKVALEAIQGRYTVRELAAKYEIHPTLINNWKRQLMEQAPELFEHGPSAQAKESEIKESELYEEIGRLKVQLEWLKKKRPCSRTEMRALADRGSPHPPPAREPGCPDAGQILVGLRRPGDSPVLSPSVWSQIKGQCAA